MPINASIPLGVQPLQIQPRQPDNKLNMLAQVMQLQQADSGNRLNALKIQEAERGFADQAAIRAELSAPGANPQNILMRFGRVKEAADFAQSEATRRNQELQAKKVELETGLKKMQHAGSVLSLAKDPASYAQVRQVIASTFGPEFAQQFPEQYDPKTVQAIMAQGQTITEKLAAEHQRLTREETGRHNQATEGLTARGQNISAATTRRGQDMVDQRSREANQAATRGQFLETPDGYVLANPKSGHVTPVMGSDGQPLKGKAANRQLTDSQGKANLFGSRMAESHRILNDLEGKYSPMAVNAKMSAAEIPGIGGAAGYAGNLMLSKEGQMAEQAQRDFINAVLRRESGAVISPPEFANGQKQYFPQPGDTQEVLAQKRRNRELAINGMAAEVPGGLRSTPSLTGTGQNGGASGGWGIQRVN